MNREPPSSATGDPLDDSSREPLRSVHTSTFPQILELLGLTVAVTTYQAGKLVLLRAEDGVLNTHFRVFPKPMGLAIDARRLAIGTATDIWEFHNVPQAAAKLGQDDRGANKHDACFFPRRAHVTGDIQIHEMVWSSGELWYINTAFSCLCTRSEVNSFQPRWRPPFISGLAPEDRCHLNGLGLVDGIPRYVTALGMTDVAGGWRANKRDGGIVLDVATNEIVAQTLSMPHSPRWHRGQLWILNSGTGGMGTIDLSSGSYHEHLQLPGFPRGLFFAGQYAFVGLSQVRETAVFSGIPLVDRIQERQCGVWVVDLDAGSIAGFVRFEDAVQEIFAVEPMGFRYPDLLNEYDEILAHTYVLDDASLKDVPRELRGEK